MTKKEFNTERFEKDSLAAFEKLLQGYRKAKQLSVWESKMDNLVDKLTHLTTDPFLCELMELFDYNYLVLSESIEDVIEKALVIREQMKHTQRFVTISEKYFSLPFLTKNTYLKRLEVFNNEDELCYLLVGRIRISLKNLLLWSFRTNKNIQLRDIFSFKQKTVRYKELAIYYYSPILDLSSTNHKDYYNFFCDYYGKTQFTNYFNSKDRASSITELSSSNNAKSLDKVLNLSSSQQVLWAYFFFRLMGLRLHNNVEAAILTRFLLIINRADLTEYKNSYFYKLVSKAPHVKDDKNLLSDLEIIRVYFQNSKLPTGDIEKEILNLITK